MKHFTNITLIALFLSGITVAQNLRPKDSFGSKGLLKTKAILSELNLPDWLWAGAHQYDNVQRSYRLIDGELLKEYFTLSITGGIHDPQHILTENQRDQIEQLISTHDMNSAMPIHLNVLYDGQKIPFTEDEMRHKLGTLFKDKNALVIFYHYGDARGTKGYVLLDRQGFVDGWEVDELFLKSARDASIQIDNFTEMESFVSDFSKRSFWLEQKLMPPVAAKKRNNQLIEQKENSQWETTTQLLLDHKMKLLLALLPFILGVFYYLWSRRWSKYTLHCNDVPVRLGADYGANVSETIEFSNPNTSLANQYEKTKNKTI